MWQIQQSKIQMIEISLKYLDTTETRAYTDIFSYDCVKQVCIHVLITTRNKFEELNCITEAWLRLERHVRVKDNLTSTKIIYSTQSQ